MTALTFETQNSSSGMRLSVVVALIAVLSACGYDGSYRYPCQNPDNWTAAECNPPICEADGTCTKFLVPEGVITNE